MAWTTPRTWVVDEVVTASVMNVHVRDNMNALKDPPTDQDILNLGADITVTSATFVDADATNLSEVIVTKGGDVLIGFSGTMAIDDTEALYIDVWETIEGTLADNDGMFSTTAHAAGAALNCSFVFLVRGLTARAHQFKLRVKSTGGSTVTIYAGAGTANADLHPNFWVKEI